MIELRRLMLIHGDWILQYRESKGFREGINERNGIEWRWQEPISRASTRAITRPSSLFASLLIMVFDFWSIQRPGKKKVYLQYWQRLFFWIPVGSRLCKAGVPSRQSPVLLGEGTVSVADCFYPSRIPFSDGEGRTIPRGED